MGDSPQTFEERLSEELDAVYQGALFLAGGRKRDAERLTVAAATLAHAEHGSVAGAEPSESSLAACLVRTFLESTRESARDSAPPSREGSPPPLGRLREVGPEELFRAVSGVPPLPRAALWLVLFRRWSYGDAAAALGVAREELHELLRYRRLLVARLSRGTSRGGIAGFGA